jgi:hypothetical protein
MVAWMELKSRWKVCLLRRGFGSIIIQYDFSSTIILRRRSCGMQSFRGLISQECRLPGLEDYIHRRRGRLRLLTERRGKPAALERYSIQ